MQEEPGSTHALGWVSSSTWDRDPKRLLFLMSRYKFVAKMLIGSKQVLEIGCGDGWGSRLVAEEVDRLILTDYDPRFIENARAVVRQWTSDVDFSVLDITSSQYQTQVDAVYCLDVLEHIEPGLEQDVFSNVYNSLVDGGVFIVGMPSIESQSFIPEERRDPGHINCKSLYELQASMKKCFKTVLPFSMNDEVLHTGQAAMSNYIFAVGVK